MIKGKLLTYGDNLDDVFLIREKVFQKELKIEKNIDIDGKDIEAMHVLVEDGKGYVATGRITYDGEKCEISKIAVLKEYRNKKYGDFVLRMLVNRGIIAGVDKIIIVCDKKLEPFFSNVGFKTDYSLYNKEYNTISMYLEESNFKTCSNCNI